MKKLQLILGFVAESEDATEFINLSSGLSAKLKSSLFGAENGTCNDNASCEGNTTCSGNGVCSNNWSCVNEA